jgi:predicted amidohydrolase YtcJ
MKSIPTHALAIGLILATERHAQTADAIFHSGTILTISDDQPSVESVAVLEGRFIATGSKAMVLKTKRHNTNLSNL